MLQRIQTVYFTIVAVGLIWISFGATIFSFQLEKKQEVDVNISMNVFGTIADGTIDLKKEDESKNMQQFLKLKSQTNRLAASPIVSFPFYLISIFLSMLALAVLLSYKKLETQQKLGRLSFVTLLVGLIIVTVIFYATRGQLNGMLEGLLVKSRLGIGYYLLIVATAFSFLGNLGVKRDLDLLKSIDRIR